MTENNTIDTRVIVKRLMKAGFCEVKAGAIATEILESSSVEQPTAESDGIPTPVYIIKFCSTIALAALILIGTIGTGVVLFVSMWNQF